MGLLILLGATLLLWFAYTIAGQVTGRALQGLASVVVWTSGLAILVDTVGSNHIGEYMGYVGIALNAGSLVAPSLGGIVFAKLGYHAVFGLIIGIIALDILFRAIMVEKTPSDHQAPRLSEALPDDLENAVQELSGGKSIQKTTTISTIEVSISSDITSTCAPRRRIHPIIRLICSLRFIVALWGFVVLSTVFSGFQATLPIFVHDTFGWDAVGGGLIFIPLSFPAVFGPSVGRFTDKHGGRWFTSAGFLLLAVSLVLLRLIDKDTTTHKVLFCVLLLLIGSCMALILEPLFAEVTQGAARLDQEDKEQGLESTLGYYGSAYAWFNIAWSGGNSVGPVIAGLIMNKSGWDTMTWVLSLLSGVSALPVVLWCGGWYF